MIQSSSARPLIVGAGPVGLAAALFLAREGVTSRIIESRPQRSDFSKALAVNPRTLQLLEPTGITERMLDLGEPIRGAQFWRGQEMLGEINFSELPHKYQFMVALAQPVTERLLAEALAAEGIEVERGVELASCRESAGQVEALARHSATGETEQITCPWLLGADGSRSTVRESLNIDFPGSTFPEPWHLVDVPLQTNLAPDRAHIQLLDEGGFTFNLRVIEDRNNPPPGDAIWRVIGTDENPVARLDGSRATGPATWKSQFIVSHKIASKLQAGNVCIAGDAAHIHSPVGARGMNLGIEDAWIFSRLVKTGQLARFGEMRHGVDRAVVRRIELISRFARGQSGPTRFLRRFLVPRATRISAVRARMMQTVTGLDHPLDVV